MAWPMTKVDKNHGVFVCLSSRPPYSVRERRRSVSPSIDFFNNFLHSSSADSPPRPSLGLLKTWMARQPESTIHVTAEQRAGNMYRPPGAADREFIGAPNRGAPMKRGPTVPPAGRRGPFSLESRFFCRFWLQEWSRWVRAGRGVHLVFV